MMGYGWYGWMGMGLWGGFLMLVVAVAIVLLVVWAVRSGFPVQRQSEQEGAVDILKRRFAAGEISQAEYEQARKALG